LVHKYKLERGLLWPSDDIKCAQVIFNGAADLKAAYPYCRGFEVVVQAGGNCGVWPRDLAMEFQSVYTFEPDPVNFRCLCANAPQENVFKFNAALGDKRGAIDLLRKPENCGAYRVDCAGQIPVMMIDDLGLAVCDLIYLDIEGFELPALRGARNTIEKCRPVVVVEDKGVSEHYGIAKGEVENFMISQGYKVAERVSRDVVMIPC
jgi:FkbM family methyltransferase